MALYRCAACGSPNVVADTQNEGYNYVKGAVGTAILGVGGAVAGINGKAKRVYKCPDCGLTLNKPMSLEIKTAIDIGVSSPETRKYLKLDGIVVGWEVFERKYKNIEKDIATSTSTQRSISESKTPATTKRLNDLTREELNDLKQQIQYADTKYAISELAYKEETKFIDAQRKEKLNAEMNKLRTSLEKSAKDTLERTMQTLTTAKEDYTERKDKAEQSLNTLGFLQFSEKSRAKKEVATMIDKLDDVNRSINNAQWKYAAEMRDVDQKLKARQEQLVKEIRTEKKYPRIPDEPSYLEILHKNGVIYDESYTTSTFGNNLNIKRDISSIEDQMDILEFLKENSPATINDIKRGCVSLKNHTNPRIVALIRPFMETGKVVRTEDAHNAYFSIK